MFEYFQVLVPDLANVSDISNLVLTIPNEILSTEPDRLELLSKKLKQKVFELIKEKGKPTTSQIANRFNIKFEEAHFILKDLEKEGKIRFE